MKFNTLGESTLQVSAVGLGTMTWGQQNTMAQAHEQLDYARAQGINFIDVAEMYPVPPKAETQGRTESFVGEWLKRQQRDQVVVATKITGPGRGFQWVREGRLSINMANVTLAVENSLKRLQTDYIDLYQIHWPDRNVPGFGAWSFDPTKDRETVPIREQLEAMAAMVRAGKIRYVGLSNETPWGMMEFLRIAREHGLPRVVSTQNAYSLLNRVFEYGLSEIAHREHVGLIPYSMLAFGHLTGKYLKPETAQGRVTMFPGFGQRYEKANVAPAAQAYATLAAKAGVTPAALAQAFVASRWFVSTALVGATSMAQLKENIAAAQTALAPDVLQEIEAIHLRYTNPAP